jgi:Fe-S-cluster containining protein
MMNLDKESQQKEILRKMRGKLDRLSDQIECNTCELCEEGAVYVLSFEVPLMERLGIPLINIDGSYFLEKKGQYCPAHDKNNKMGRRCKIYSERPICCRLFPMDIFVENGQLKWIVFNDCPIVKHKLNNNSLNAFTEIAEDFEALITKEIADEFKREYDAWEKTDDPFLHSGHYKCIKNVEIGK